MPNCTKCGSADNGFNRNPADRSKFLNICKKCRAIDARKYKKNHLDKVVAANAKRLSDDPRKKIMNNARKRAKQKGFDINITKEDLVIPKICPVLGIPLVFSNKQTDNSPSIDRIDNARGYVLGNVQVISWRANNLKSNGSLVEFEAIVRHLKELL